VHTQAVTRPTIRLLTLLEILQSCQRISGPELATRLNVNIRTLRRYVAALQDLGVPVMAEAGRNGAYSLVEGFKLPPMMFTNDEALALSIGLMAARRLGMAEGGVAIEGTAAKLQRALPTDLRAIVDALNGAITLDLPQPPGQMRDGVLLVLGLAAHARQCVRLRYCNAENIETDRDIDPYGLILRDGGWYVIGYCHMRQAQRSFRLDRVRSVQALSECFVRPDGFKPIEMMDQSLLRMPRRHQIRVFFNAIGLTAIQEELPRDSFILEPLDGGVLMHGRSNSLEWVASVLARFRCPFQVLEPDELRHVIVAMAEHLLRCARTETRA
jgi:predicted DNA-binding transcriptional regulator YafY